MFDIKCKRIGCEFNKNCNCTAKDLEVTKNTQCKTYKPTEEQLSNTTAKIGQPPFRKNILVDCKANCLFNHNQQCSANGIYVQTLKESNEPSCCTFKPK